MPVSLESIVSQLQESGIISPSGLAECLPPKSRPKNAEELLRNLVGRHLLSKFQVTQIAQGKTKALILGSYTLLDKIGAGGMGQVFKAEHRRMKRIVAIKTLPSATMKNSSAIARFQREVEAAAKLTHPNIVTAHDADEANGLHFLVMEYVEGKDLSGLVKQNGPITVERAADYILQAARGLEYAHHKGVVHRDIKPANLLLDSEGTIKILDMGLARIDGNDDSPPVEELTGTGAVMGTLDYMAPEQWANSHTADARTDLYALGCSLCYLVNGRAPYADAVHRDPVSKMKAHLHEPIPDLQASGPVVSDDIQAVYQKMMAKNAGDRYQSATALIEDLAPIAARAPITKTTAVYRPTSMNSSDHSRQTSHGPTEAIDQGAAPTSISAGSLEALIDTARKLFASHDFAGVVGVLEGVPPATRTEAMDELLELATRQQAQCDRLLHEIDVAKETHRSKELLAKCEQLLKLKPGHAPTRRVLRALKSYGGKLDSAKFDANDEPLKMQEASGIFKGFGTYYAATIVTAVVAFGVGTALIWSYLANTGRKSKDDNLATAPKEPVVPDHPNQNPTAPTEHASSDLKPAISLFNGRDLTGWSAPAKAANWKVNPAESVLTATGTSGSDWIFTNNEYGDFVLTLEYQAGSEVNSGVALLGSADGKTYLEVQIGEDSKVSTGGFWCQPDYVAVTRAAKEKSAQDWNSMEITMRSRVVKVVVNGIEVSHVNLDEQAKRLNVPPTYQRTHGRIGLQSMKNAVGFRNIRLAEFATTGVPVVPIRTFETPEFKEWMKQVAAQPAKEQIAMVKQKLKELNPDYEGRISDVIQKGVVRELKFATVNISDISPVRALKGLHSLDCSGFQNRWGKLTDLSPLEGMKLTKLHCGENNLSDLSGLKGLPLTELWIDFTRVTNLKPLEGMPLKYLGFWNTGIKDLSPLKGMQLNDIYCAVTPVSDLSPLQGMPLSTLECPYTDVTDLTPLAQIQTLRRLSIINCKVKAADIESLKSALPNCTIQTKATKQDK